ncbi:class II aldolase/adducin family protein [Streptomyces sp. NPDC055078]
MNDAVNSLVDLSRALGDPQQDLAIIAEGNTSLRISDTHLLVKASGRSLRSATPDDFVRIEISPILALLDDPDADDDRVTAVLETGENPLGLRPSIETMFHAIAIAEGGARAVGHTHPPAVNGILCSDRASALTDGFLFPEHVGVLGGQAAMVPYADPGLGLAREIRSALAEHRSTYGVPPKVMYLKNHGILALGATTDEVVQISQMAVKAARVLAITLSVGRPAYMSPDAVRRIDTRPDEQYRRDLLLK